MFGGWAITNYRGSSGYAGGLFLQQRNSILAASRNPTPQAPTPLTWGTDTAAVKWNSKKV